MSEQEIKQVFDALGLGTSEQREQFRQLENPNEASIPTYTFIRLDSGSTLNHMEEKNAELASDSRRNQS